MASAKLLEYFKMCGIDGVKKAKLSVNEVTYNDDFTMKYKVIAKNIDLLKNR